jgi:hypothetical protein
MLIPTIPTFVTGESSLAHLQQLSQAVSMCSVAANFPMWRFYNGGAVQALTTSTWNTVRTANVAVDTDGVFTGTGQALIVTQGYYKCEACLPFEGQSASWLAQGVFKVVAGGSNPHYTSGAFAYFGGAATWSAYTSTSVDTSLCLNGKCPWVCYPGDTISVQTYPLSATTINNGQNNSATAGWFTPQFSGRWISIGS